MERLDIKLCCLGPAGAGKTCIAKRFVHGAFAENDPPTVGAYLYSKRIVIDGNQHSFHIWDTAGQEKYRSLTPIYYRGAAAAIVVYDITDEQSFKDMKHWIDQLQKLAPHGIVLTLVGNKCDMVEQRQVSHQEGKQYAEGIRATFFETSAKEGTNIQQVFESIGERLPVARLLRERMDTTSPTVQVTKNSDEASSRKCSSC